jgi:hypothetical protein
VGSVILASNLKGKSVLTLTADFAGSVAGAFLSGAPVLSPGSLSQAASSRHAPVANMSVFVVFIVLFIVMRTARRLQNTGQFWALGRPTPLAERVSTIGEKRPRNRVYEREHPEPLIRPPGQPDQLFREARCATQNSGSAQDTRVPDVAAKIEVNW